jgi:PAS domain S-box-containing protein
VLGIGFSQVITPSQLTAHTEAIRREGFADYTVRPVGVRDLYTSIIYLEPFSGRNLRAFGYDMWSEPVRRAAMMQARDTGEASLSGKVLLVQETNQDVQAGVLMYVPVYRHGAPVDTLEQRRAAIIGWAYSPYRMIDLTLGIIEAANNPEFQRMLLHIFDGNQVSATNILFDKTDYNPADNSFLYQERHINFNGKPWLLTFDSHDSQYQADYSVTWLILLAGITLSGLLFGLMMSIINTRSNATRLAEQQTKEILSGKALLEESEFRWRFALEGAGDGVWDWDVANATVHYSKRWKEMLGYTEEEVGTGLDEWSSRIHPEDREVTLAIAQDYLAGKSNIYISEHRVQCKDGSYKWILDRGMIVARDEAGNPLRMIGTHTDINARKQLELQLAEYNQELAVIFDLSPDGIITIDSKHCVGHVNPAFEELTGLKRVDVLGQHEQLVFDLLNKQCSPPSTFPDLAELQRFQKSTHKAKQKQYQINIEKPNKRVLEISLLEAHVGEISTILRLRNITNETEIDRMKSEFLSTAAHELRTPMSSIYGYAELLDTQELTPEEKAEFLKIILAESKTMATILNDLLDLARIEARLTQDFVMVHIDLYALIQEVAANLAVAHNRERPKLIATEQSYWINADKAKIIQVLNNVLSNAYKYSPNGGAVTMEIITPSNAIQSSLGIDADFIGIRVTDKGIGMTPEQLKHVFERFYRADTSGKILGTGLGLSIVKEIVELHHGSVTIDSVIDKGSTLTIWLPGGI